MKKSNKIFIYGKHAVKEALMNRPEAVTNVFLDEQKISDKEILAQARKFNIKISPLPKNATSLSEGSQSHQGIFAKISTAQLVTNYDDFIKNLKMTDSTGLLLLNEIQDPHNVGAIIRAGVSFGIQGILIPRHNQSPITAAVAKVSAGMVFKVPIAEIPNTNTTIRDLKERGFWIYGLDGKGKQKLPNENFEKPSVFVLGNEGSGIRSKTKDLCDIVLSIPISEKSESLNVASSASVVLYAWRSKHLKSLS